MGEKQAATEEEKRQESQIKDDIKKVESSLKISDELLKYGQKELDELTKSSCFERIKLLSVNAKINTTLNMKAELQTEQDQFTQKLTKISD